MKKFIVQWKGEEKEFDDSREASRFADKEAESGVNSYVWVENDGIREEEPIIRNEWSI